MRLTAGHILDNWPRIPLTHVSDTLSSLTAKTKATLLVSQDENCFKHRKRGDETRWLDRPWQRPQIVPGVRMSPMTTKKDEPQVHAKLMLDAVVWLHVVDR